MKPRGDFSVKQRKNVLSIRSTISRNKRSSVDKKINYKNVKKAVDQKLITDLNNQTFFTRDDGTHPSLIHVAVEKKNKELINFLLDQGIDLNVVESGQSSILKKMTSMQEFENDIELIRRVINAGADVNHPNFFVRSPNSTLSSLINFAPEAAELLIQSGHNVNPPCVCGGGSTSLCLPLPAAVYCKRNQIIDLLLKKGVDINRRCPGGCTPLMWAAINDDFYLTKRLLDLGAFVNEYYHRDETVLQMAVTYRKSKVVQILLNHESINLNIINWTYDGTIVHYAVLSKALNFIDSILDANPDVNLFDREKKLAVELNGETSMKFQNTKNKLKKHLVRLRAAGFHLDNRNLAAVSGEEFDDLYAECCGQVNSMKETKISPTSHVNFYDLLFISEQKLALCLESLDDDGILQSGYHEKFPLYAGMVQYKLNKAYSWVKLRESLNKAVYILLNNNLPTHIMEKIFSYFNVYELKKLRTYLEKNDPGNSDENLQSNSIRMDEDD